MPTEETLRRREYHRLYYIRNKEKRASKYREQRDADPEGWAQRRREYYEATREQAAARSRRYYEEHRLEKLAQAKAWAEANPDRRREIANDWDRRNPDGRRARENMRRARKRQAPCEYIDPLVVLERDDGICGICGEDVDPTYFHVDHIVPLARGGAHLYSNVQAAHPTCNIAKGAGHYR